MEITSFAINSLKKIISGDDGITTYMKGQELVDFFNSFGERDTYEWGNGGIVSDGQAYSRNDYVALKLKKLNGSKKLKELLERIVNYNSPNREVVVERLNHILAPEKHKFEEIEGGYILVTNTVYNEEVVKEVHFEEIQSQILTELNLAKFTIWVAVAWFTDKVLFDKLIEKKNQGINVQIIVIDDEVNMKYGFDYETYFETNRVTKNAFDNIMHHKFCVIDLDTVINGSYNWTNKARYNQENITIDKSRVLAESFAKQFIRLKTGK